jgi:hypothetical protein
LKPIAVFLLSLNIVEQMKYGEHIDFGLFCESASAYKPTPVEIPKTPIPKTPIPQTPIPHTPTPMR